MSISFSGLASGMDTSSWVEALVSVKQSEITKLETKKSTIAAAQDTLNSVKSYFSSFQSLLQNITDAQLGIPSLDLFSQNLAESSNLSVLSAIADTSAKNATYNIEVNKLATATEVNSGLKVEVTTTVTDTATSETRLFDLYKEKDDDSTLTPITAGDIVFEIDGFRRTVSVDSTTTMNDFIDSLYSIGIDADYNESTGVFSMNADSDAIKSDTTGVMLRLNLEDVNDGYCSDVINLTIVTPTTASIDSQLNELGITDQSECAFTVTENDGTVHYVTSFTPDSNLAQVLNYLDTEYNIQYDVSDDGVLTLTSNTDGNVFGGALAEMLNLYSVEDPYISMSKMTSTDIVYSIQETLVNRDSTLGQIGAVTSASDRLIIKKCDGGTTVTTVTSLTESSTVQDLFDVLAANGITATINDGIISLNSTTGNYIDGAIATNLGILAPDVDHHYTTEAINMTSSSDINTAMSLGGLGMSSDGSVVIYSPVYGIVSVNIAKELTVQGFCDRINDSNYGIKAEIVGGRVKISELEHSGSYVKGMSQSIKDVLKLNAGEDLSYNSTTINVYSNTDSGYIKYNDDVELNANTTISSIKGYQNGTGAILLHQSTVEKGQDGAFHTTITETTITVDPTLTIDEFINNPIVGLAQYNLYGNILSDGKAYLTSDGDTYLEEIVGGSNILTALNFSGLSQKNSGQHVRATSKLNSTTIYTTTTVAATTGTELASLSYETIKDGNTETVWFDSLYSYETVIDGRTKTVTQDSTLVFKVNDYYKTVTLKQDDTIGSLIDKLNDVGINAYITRGQFYIASGYDNVEYISSESTSNLMEDFIKLGEPEKIGGYSASSAPVKSQIINTTQERISASNYADRNTKLSTVSITGGSLTIYRNGQRATIDIEDGDTFSDLEIDLNSKFSDLHIDFDDDGFLRDGKLKIYSKNLDGTVNKDVNISIGSTSDKSNFVAITGIMQNSDNQLESSRMLYKVNDKTSLDESGLFRAYAKGSSLLNLVGISEGEFTINKNGLTSTISISDDDTFNSLQTKLQNAFSDLYISFESDGTLSDGKLKICSTENNASISISTTGSNQSSNIASVCNFLSDPDKSSATSQRLYQKTLSGSFKVGDANIYISTDNNGKITTTIGDIVSQINSSEKSLATAYWDSIDGKLVIKSTLTGASAVNIEAGDTNFTELLGLTKGSNLVLDAQTIGSNAVLTINGTKYTSLSNNVKSDATSIEGLTINLKGLSNGSTVTLSVKHDTETLVNAVSNVLDRYNELIASVDSAIAKDGDLKDQSMLRLIRNSIRTAMNSSDPGTDRFRNLASIGIKAASESNASNISTSNNDITFLSLDKDKFLEALENYQDDVKALLVGRKDSNNKVINKGILSKVEELVKGALSAVNGYFATANNSFNTQKEAVNQKIVNGTLALEKYRKSLEHKFSSMDIMIASMQNQFSSFLS